METAGAAALDGLSAAAVITGADTEPRAVNPFAVRYSARISGTKPFFPALPSSVQRISSTSAGRRKKSINPFILASLPPAIKTMRAFGLRLRISRTARFKGARPMPPPAAINKGVSFAADITEQADAAPRADTAGSTEGISKPRPRGP